MDSRHAKLPKLGFQSNLEAFQHDLREDLRVVIRVECDRVQRELSQDLSAPHEQFKAQLGMLKPEIGQLRTELKLLQTQVATNGDAQRTIVKGHRDDVQQDLVSTEQRICNTMDRRITELATRQDAYMTASQNAGYEMQQEILSSEQRVFTAMEQRFAALGSNLDAKLQSLSTGIIQELCSAMEQRVRALSSNLEAKIQALSAEVIQLKAVTPPRPLQEVGFLVQECPAPEGQTQREFESHLFRACLTYVNQFWSPFDGISGVDQSPLALEETKKRFPNLPEPAIVKALEFFHQQIFNQPLAQPPPDDVCAEALRMLKEHDPGAVSG